MQILVFGDSIAYGANDPEGGWAASLRKILVRKMLDSKYQEYYTIYNLAISGDTTGDLIERCRFEIEQRIYDGEKDRVIIFAIGINDSCYVNTKDHPIVSLNDFRSNIQQLVNIARSFESRVIFVGLADIDESKLMPLPWRTDTYVTRENRNTYNAVLGDFCAQHSVPFIDMTDVLTFADLDDGIHPNTEGHKKIFEKIKGELTNLLKIEL